VSVNVHDFAVVPFASRPLGLISREIQQQSGIHADRESREIFEVCVPSQHRVAAIEDRCVEADPGNETTRCSSSDATPDDDRIVFCHN
jgi:hypothetical protein